MGKIPKNRIIIQGLVKTRSPLHIGCGSDERSDMDILLDEKGQPFIPATALIGLLRHEIGFADPELKKAARGFWGYAEGDAGHQSAIRCRDLTCCSESQRSIRDGVKIDNRRGMVIEQGKYDYEIIEPGAVFSLDMEITLSGKDGGAFEKRMAGTIYRLLNTGNLRIGAKTNNGLGRLQLQQKDTKIYHFDFSKKKDVLNWLCRRFETEQAVKPEALGDPFPCGAPDFSILATLTLKNSLIIRTYPTDPEMPDAVHIRSGGEPVMTGSSLKGAIRARAEKIALTCGKSAAIVDSLFGYVSEEAGESDARKGRIRIEEALLPPLASEVQHRIRIDRFTGGVIEGGLFDSMPLFSDSEEKTFNIAIDVSPCTAPEAGLLLLVLKDLWTADLAVGGEKNVGRGVFEGRKATIRWEENCFVLAEDLSGTAAETRQELQNLVTAFQEKG